MKIRLLAALCLCAMAGDASAQFWFPFGGGHNSHRHSRHVQSPHIDHHDHVIRDSHGHIQGIEHHDVVHGGAHIDHHDHIIRDRHGHVVGREHHDVIHNNRSHVVPGTIHGYATGQYYVQDNLYYYTPQSSNQYGARPAIVRFGGFSQYSDLSGRLETLINEILLDLHHNYSHNPGFAETYREGYQLLGIVKFIHAADHNGDREAIRSRLAGTDQLFHHIEDDVRGWTRIHRRRYGTLGLAQKMELAEATLHHLMNDVGVSESGNPQVVQPAGPTSEQAPPPAYSSPAQRYVPLGSNFWQPAGRPVQ